MKKILVLALFPALLSAQNMIPNGSFEMGTDGFRVRTVLRVDKNPKRIYHPLKAVAEPGADGKLALKLENPFGDRFEIHSRQFQFKPNTDYTFRVRAKSTADGQKVSFRAYSGRNRWHGWFFNTKLTPQWKDFSFKFKTGPNHGAPFFYHFQIRNTSNKDIPGSTIFIDKMELFETNSKPSTGVELALSIAEPLIVADKTADAKLTLKAANFSDKAWKGTVTVVAEDVYLKQNRSSVQKEVLLAPGEIKQIPVSLTTGYGAFDVTASAKGISHSLPAAYAVIGKYEYKPLDFENDFCVALNTGCGLIESVQDPNRGFHVYNIDYEKKFEYMAKMGCRMIREHDGGYESTAWSLMEPERGKWDFSNMDFQNALMKKYGFEIMPCIERFNMWVYIQRQKWTGVPRRSAWLEKLCVPAHHQKYNWSNSKDRVMLPPLDLFREYVRQVVTRGKGRIKFYEVFNEPSGLMSGADYFPYLKAFYEEAKKIDPSVKVIGLSATSDYGAVPTRFIKEVMALGGGEYMDIASFHPYVGRELSSAYSADRYISDFRKLLGEKYKDMPIWNSELYYVFDTNKDHGAANPGQVAARFLTDLGENVKQSTFAVEGMIWSHTSIAPEAWPDADSRVETVPNGIFAAFNALARHFEAAKPVQKIKIGSGVGVYVYRKDGKLLAALWNWDKKSGVSAGFTGLTVLDVYGNRIKNRGFIPVTGSPLYIFPGELGEKEFISRLKNLRFHFEAPVSAAPVMRNIDGKYLLATLHNAAPEDISAVVGFQGNGMTAANNIRVKVPGNGSAVVMIPIVKSEVKNSPTLYVYAKRGMQKFPVTIKETKAEAAGKEIILARDDFRAVWCIKKADGRIVFEATVKDTTNSGTAQRDPWNQDGIELFFDTAPGIMNATSYRYTPETFRVFLLPRLSGTKQMTAWLNEKSVLKSSDMKYSITPTADGYKAVLSFPADKVGAHLGFEIKFNDALPGKNTHRSISWTNNKNTHADRTAFGIIEF